MVDRYIVHAGKSVPLVGNPGGGDKVVLGETYAIETFASTGQGSVHPDFNKKLFHLGKLMQVALCQAGHNIEYGDRTIC